MKKIKICLSLCLLFLLIFVACVPPNNSPPDIDNGSEHPYNKDYELVFEEVDENDCITYTTYIHLHIEYPNGPNLVKIPTIFLRSIDLEIYEDISVYLERFEFTGRDELNIDTNPGNSHISAVDIYNPKIDTLVTMTVEFNTVRNPLNPLQIRVTKGDYES